MKRMRVRRGAELPARNPPTNHEHAVTDANFSVQPARRSYCAKHLLGAESRQR